MTFLSHVFRRAALEGHRVFTDMSVETVADLNLIITDFHSDGLSYIFVRDRVVGVSELNMTTSLHFQLPVFAKREHRIGKRLHIRKVIEFEQFSSAQAFPDFIRVLISSMNLRMAVFKSSKLSNTVPSSRGKISVSTSRTNLSQLALSLGLSGRAGSTGTSQ